MGPLHSAEMRWFWSGDCPPEVRTWFDGIGATAPGGGATRVDRYLVTSSRTLGIKHRNGQPDLEIKGFIDDVEASTAAVPGRRQRWAKWSSAGLTASESALVEVTKVRRLRKFRVRGAEVTEVPLGVDEKPADPQEPRIDEGCSVELTRITTATGSWCTLGFEAFAAFERTLPVLDAVVRFLAATPPPPLVGALQASYPEWLEVAAAARNTDTR